MSLGGSAAPWMDWWHQARCLGAQHGALPS